MKVSELMTRNVTAFRSDTTLAEAADRMNQMGVRHFPVVDRGQHVVGMISARDLCGDMGQELDDVMSAPAYTIGPGDTPARAARLMLQHRVGCLPVVVDGCLVGILSERDLLKVVAGTGGVAPAGPARHR